MTPCTREPIESGKPREPTKLAIVDDDENDRFLINHAVDRSGGLECVGLYSGGGEALNGIHSLDCEVVLLDVRMPKISGFECARQLRKAQPHLVIIMISGFDQPDTAAQAMEAGADAYLIKPFSLARFFETLTECHRISGANGAQTPRAPGFIQTSEASRPIPPRFPLPSSDQCPGIAIERQRSSTGPNQGLSADDSAMVRNALRRIVIGLEENFHIREDLLQEALVHFWSSERHYPGQRLSWYLRGVRFYLHHLMASGRSVDSPKHRGARAAFSENCDGWDQWRDILEFDEGIMSAVNASDIFSLLVNRLEPIDQTILSGLAHGLIVREIAQNLQVSPMFVVRHRRQIATLALNLGIERPGSAGKFRPTTSEKSKPAEA